MITVFLFCLFSSPASVSLAAEWVYLTSDEQGVRIFYDRETIERSGTRVKVSEKEVYGERHLMRIRDRLGGVFSDLTETVSLREIDCGERQSRVESVAQYDSSGEVISIRKNTGKEWTAISPKSAVNLLYELCCPADWRYVTSSADEEYFLNTDRITVHASTVTFWMKGIHKNTGRETEQDRITIQCRKSFYALHQHISYEPEGKVAQVSSHRQHVELSKISSGTIISAFQEIVCADSEPRQNIKEYLREVQANAMPVRETIR
ncbi:MAG: surface-adhesin E family protein [Nitrospirota bacterium]